MLRQIIPHFRNNISRSLFGYNCLKSFASASTDSHTESLKEGTPSEKPKFDDRMLSLLVCPLNKKKLRYDEKRQLLINDELSIGYKIINGIPNMIPTEALKLDN